MLFLRSWIEDYLGITHINNEDLSELITMKSGEVEEYVEISDYFGGRVLVGRIFDVQKHPDADKLQVFSVDLGENGIVQIVSAAPNVKENLLVPVATVGCKLPIGTILERKMRGVVSQGMCLGKSELLLETEYSSGLWELNDLIDITKVGTSICSALPDYFPTETVFDIKFLADRLASAGNHLGLALDLSICLENPKLLSKKAQDLLNPEFLIESMLNSIETEKPIGLTLEFNDTTNYTNSLYIYNLKLQKEFILPHEMQKRMFLTNRNLIGGLADLSNYLLADIGQPNHFFSLPKVQAISNSPSELVWNFEPSSKPAPFSGLGQLKQGHIPEGMVILNGEPRGSVQKIISIPGISGGDETKVEPEDTEILIEIANFPAESIARSSFQLNYRSEGAKIWSSRVNPALQVMCTVRLHQILEEGQHSYTLTNLITWVSQELENVYKIKTDDTIFQKTTKILEGQLKREVFVDIEYLTSKLDHQNVDHWETELENKLKLLGEYSHRRLRPNIFYGHIETQEDVLEQLIRLIGFSELHQDQIKQVITHKEENILKGYTALKKLLSEFGLVEIISRPFIEQNAALDPASSLEIINPNNSQKPFLRDSLLGTLLETVAANMLQGEKECRLFELNKVYSQHDDINSRVLLSGVSLHSDPYFTTSLILAIANKTSATDYTLHELSNRYQKLGYGYEYHFENGIVANIIQINNKTKKVYQIPISKPIWGFEIDITGWDQKTKQYANYFEDSEYPIIRRTYSFEVDPALTWKEVQQIVDQTKLTNTEIRVNPTERFSEKAKDILNFEVEFVNYGRTLENNEIKDWETQLINNTNGALTPRI